MISRDDALSILDKHIKNPNLRKHCLAVEAAMAALAVMLKPKGSNLKTDAYNIDKWKLVGLLHDADWEETQDDPATHTKKTIEWLAQAGETNTQIREAILSHNYERNGFRAPNSKMEWALYTCDELTGLIIACALVRPDKKLKSVKVKSVLKKFPIKSFAAGANREQIRLCEEKLGIELAKFVEVVLGAMQEISDELGL